MSTLPPLLSVSTSLPAAWLDAGAGQYAHHYAAGRPTKDPERLKKSPNLSLTDAEDEKLGQLVATAKLGRSEHTIDRLCLDK